MKIVLLLLIAFCPALFAQQANDEEEAGLQSIVDASDTFNMSIELGTVTYQVPVPDMGEYNFTVFVFLGQASGRTMSSSAKPDALGVIRQQVSLPMNLINDMDVQEQFSSLLLAYNRYSRNRVYYLNMQNVSLRVFLGTIMHSMLYASNYQSRPSIEYENESARDLTISLQGDRLSPAQVYSLIQQQTGCIIDEVGNRAIIVSACS